jgi:CRISPR-associated endonuclease/helicase Cas3
MANPTPDDFAEFFRAVHTTEKETREPFDWQKRLASEVLAEHRWPDAIRVPTGCGKTSVLDLAVFDLALQASRKVQDRTAPRRICFVIDRRLVVDEVTDHAQRLVRVILKGAQGSDVAPVVKAVANQLAELAVDGAQPLRLIRLRGGVYRDDGWAADPLTPTIIVSTVDQVGSRLLFRGYGVSQRNLPVHAGLLAFDTRIILDEAHLSGVFADTLDSIRYFQKLAETSPLPPERLLTVVRMSATAGSSARLFDLLPDDRNDARLKPRIEAPKPALLVPVAVEAITKKLRSEQPRKARDQERRNRLALVNEIVAQAQRQAGLDGQSKQPNPPRVIGIVVNRVATARHVFERLRKLDATGSKALLLTGRVRPFDRDRLLEEWLPRIRAGREQEPQGALFIVATQTVEVGANLDFDALVTEAAPLDALRQRFGRLDRLAKRHARGAPSPASIVIRSDHAKDSDDDAIYGSAIATAWKWLSSEEVASTTGKGAAKKQRVDFGINSLDAKLPKDPDVLRPMLAPIAETPVLFPAHLDAWVQTNPRPDPDPDVAPFLHGRADTPADVLVVWRADLDEERTAMWPAIVSAMPPLTREALPVPIHEVRAWLQNAAAGNVADVEGCDSQAEPREPSGAERSAMGRKVLRWRGRRDAKVVEPDDLRPGDTVVVPATYGGSDRFGWNPDWQDPVEDIAERCLAQLVASYPSDAFRRPKIRLRLHPSLLPEADDSTGERLRALLRALVSAATSEGRDARDAMRRLMQSILPLVNDPYVKAAIEAMQGQRCRLVMYPADDGIVAVASVAISLPPLPDVEQEEDEPEDDEASFIGRIVPLGEHVNSVTEIAREFAKASGVERALVETIHLAGLWHDEGKRDWRFQAWLRGSELRALAEEGDPIAKSGLDSSQWGSSTDFGYPRGARHEFVSVRLFEQVANAAPDGVNVELAKFLIGTHHGFGRPFAPVVQDRNRNPVDVKMTHEGRALVVSSDHRLHRIDSGWVDLFWSLLRRFGWWGLAYLEALLITADRSVSAREQGQAGSKKGKAA